MLSQIFLFCSLALATHITFSDGSMAEQVNSKFRIHYANLGSAIQFMLCGNFSGYMSIGFNPSSTSMSGTDILVATLSNSQWTVLDYYSTSNSYPSLDTSLGGTNDVSNILEASAKCYSTQGVIFTRNIVTGDINYDVSLNQNIYLQWAYSSSATLSYHSNSRGNVVNVLLTNAVVVGGGNMAITTAGVRSTTTLAGVTTNAAVGAGLRSTTTLAGVTTNTPSLSLLASAAHLQLTSVYRIHYVSVNNIAHFWLCGNFSGYMSIGFNSGNYDMTNSDIIAATFDGTKWSVNDYFSTDNSDPTLDTNRGGTNDVLSFFVVPNQCYSSQGIYFNRYITTNDASNDVSLSIPVILQYAYLPGSYGVSYHSGNAGTFANFQLKSAGTVGGGVYTSPGAMATSAPSVNQSAIGISNVKFYQVSSDFRIHWAPIGNNLQFWLCSNITSYLSVGFNSQNRDMTNSIIVVAIINNNNWQVASYFSNSNSFPVANSANDITGIQDAKQECSSTKGVKFLKPISSLGFNINSPINFQWAYYPNSAGLVFHQNYAGNVPNVVLNYNVSSSSSSDTGGSNQQFSQSGNSVSNLMYYHFISIFVAVSLGFPIGIAFVRIIPTFVSDSILWHGNFMVFFYLVMLFTSIPLILIQIDSNFVMLHSLVGVALLGAMFFTSLIGYLQVANTKMVRFNPKTCKLTRALHRVLGWICVLACWINGYLGLNYMFGSNIIVNFFYCFYMFLIFLIFVASYLMKDRLNQIVKATGITNNRQTRINSIVSFSWKEFNERIIGNHSKWLVISDFIYDVGEFMQHHPAGEKLLTLHIGTNATRHFYGTFTTALSEFKQIKIEQEEDDNIKVSTNNLVVKGYTKDKQENMHSPVAMQKLSGLLIGRIADGDEDDEDDLIRPRKESQQDSKEITQEKLKISFIATTKQTGASSNYFVNLRLMTKESVTPKASKTQVFRFRFAFDRPNHRIVCLPGHIFEFLVNDESSSEWHQRKYTPIKVINHGTIDFIIKIHEKGKLTSSLSKLKNAGYFRLKGPLLTQPLLNPKSNDGCYENLILICGGTGITPMLHLLDYYLMMKKGHKGVVLTSAKSIQLIQNFSTKDDIIAESTIENYKNQFDGILRVETITNQRLDTTILNEIINSNMIKSAAGLHEEMRLSSSFHTFVCGPPAFNEAVNENLQQIGIESENISVLL